MRGPQRELRKLRKLRELRKLQIFANIVKGPNENLKITEITRINKKGIKIRKGPQQELRKLRELQEQQEIVQGIYWQATDKPTTG